MNPAPALYPLLTVGEHLRFYARAHHVGERRALHNLHNLLAGQVDDVLCRDLTSTQAHMVWFTAAISCHGAGLLVLDEPFAAAAPDQTENMISLVQAHVRTGGSVLLSSRVHGNLLSNTRWRTHTLKSPEAP